LCYNNSKIIEGKYKMLKTDRKAFTMIELVMVIVVIGVLSAIAIPRFSSSADSAYFAKAKSTIVTVRNALQSERQRRVLRGDYTAITALNLSSNGGGTANAFDHFSADTAGNFSAIFQYPITACSGNNARACWAVSGNNLIYTYRFPKASDGNDGQAQFTLGNNRLDCSDGTPADCRLVIQ